MTLARIRMAAFRSRFGTGRRRSRLGRRGPLALALLVAAGCHSMTAREPAPERPIAAVLATHTPELMRLEGVVGTAESRLADGRTCVLVMVSRMTPELRRRIPERLEGWPVRVETTGPIRAMPDSAP